MKRGVIYYAVGDKMAVRQAVSVHSLRKHYDGPVTILSDGAIANAYTHAIGERYKCDVREVQFHETTGKNTTYLNACLCAQQSPYDNTVWIDADTTIHSDFSELFDLSAKHEFAVAHFSNWMTNGGQIKKRIENWRGILPDEWIDRAVAFGPAINCGVFACRSDSKLLRDWHKHARKGQHTRIPDEVCCQILIAQPEYPATIGRQEMNCSCKYGGMWAHRAAIMHYHGNKHCRFDDKFSGPLYNCLYWYREFDEIRSWWPVREYINKDRQLRKNLKRWDKWRTSKTDHLPS